MTKKLRAEAIRIANMVASNIDHRVGSMYLPFQIWEDMGIKHSLAASIAGSAANEATKKIRSNGTITKAHYAEAECMLREGWEPDWLVDKTQRALRG